ncbi:MAG: hypothetical protein U0P28_08330 [Ruminococcus sp.]|nr:hypothetical protein [uncultured Ruminococcus sp.]MBQ1350780.1 hypothetical protein [Ruminococcus sp.]MBQ1617649.1 hypothetical protein [Ruminococcus sp.]MBQ2469635.1 hypothetical protein [Ruminococcus sp.]SCX03776.1 hypothetical protein SAMN02910436_00272 [Ruminococcaceae bacterium P7]
MSDKMNELLGQLSKKLNMSPEGVKRAADSGDYESLLQNTDCDTSQVREVLSDPEKTRQLLNSPQAQALLKMLQK